MKNNTYAIDKFVQPRSIGARVIPLLVALAAAMLTQPLLAQVAISDIQISENSSTSLSATFETVPLTAQNIQNTAPDRWTLTFPDTITFFVFTINGWTEPESALGDLGNIVDSPGTHQLFVLSDVAIGSNIADGTPVSENPSVNITFHDNAANAEAAVPDAGSTFGLLFMSVAALFGASRRLGVRLA